MTELNDEAKAVIKRIEVAAERFGEVFDVEKITEAMRRHYAALGIPMPRVMYVENWEDGYKAAWEVATAYKNPTISTEIG